jgi:hypothetical protein
MLGQSRLCFLRSLVFSAVALAALLTALPLAAAVQTARSPISALQPIEILVGDGLIEAAAAIGTGANNNADNNANVDDSANNNNNNNNNVVENTKKPFSSLAFPNSRPQPPQENPPSPTPRQHTGPSLNIRLRKRAGSPNSIDYKPPTGGISPNFVNAKDFKASDTKRKVHIASGGQKMVTGFQTAIARGRRRSDKKLTCRERQLLKPKNQLHDCLDPADICCIPLPGPKTNKQEYQKYLLHLNHVKTIKAMYGDWAALERSGAIPYYGRSQYQAERANEIAGTKAFTLSAMEVVKRKRDGRGALSDHGQLVEGAAERLQQLEGRKKN